MKNSDRILFFTIWSYLLVLAGHPVVPQSAFLDEAQYGGGISITSELDERGFLAARSRAVYAVNGMVDLGADVGVVTESGIGQDSTVVEGAVAWAVTLLKQDRIVPVSVQIRGSFLRSVVNSSRLQSEGLRKTGGGYAISAEAFRFARVTPRLYRRVGVMAVYESRTYVTEREDGTTDGAFPIGTAEQRLYYGGILGLSLRPNRSNRGIAVSFDVRPYMTPDASFGVMPVLTFTVVHTRHEV